MPRVLLTVMAIAVASLGSAIRAQADPVTIAIADLDALRLVGTTPGATLTVFGTVANNTSSVLFLNSSGGSSNDNDPANSVIVLDSSFHIRPGGNTYVLQPREVTARIPFVTLFISPGSPNPSLTTGSILICGGASTSACDSLGEAFYSVRVSTAPPVPTPEPGTMMLLGTGCAGLVARARRKRQARIS
jgi:hypothetical protein